MAYNPGAHQSWVGQQGPPRPPPRGSTPQDLQQIFRSVDADNNGFITALELQKALGSSLFNAETCRLIHGLFDRDHDGLIGYQEFEGLWQYIQQWRHCFERYDVDRSGTIDTNELHQALCEFGYRLSTMFCNNLIRRFDRQHRRSIHFDDFIQCCVMLKCFTDGFAYFDVQRRGVVTASYEDFLRMALEHAPL